MQQSSSWIRVAVLGAVLTAAAVVVVIAQRTPAPRQPVQAPDEEVWSI